MRNRTDKEKIREWMFDYIGNFSVCSDKEKIDIVENSKFKIEYNYNTNNIICIESDKVA